MTHHPHRSHRPPRSRGFGVIEALIALILLSSVGFTVLSWIQQNLNTLQRLHGFYERLETRRNVLEWSRSVNPMAHPEGDTTLGPMRLKWQATLQGNIATQSGLAGGQGLYDLGLYNIRIDIFHPGETTPWLTENVSRTGYRKARDNNKMPL